MHVVKGKDIIITPKLEAQSPPLLVRYSSAQCVRKTKSFYKDIAALVTSSLENALYNAVLGTLLGYYEFVPFKSKEHSRLKRVTVYCNNRDERAENQLQHALVATKAVYIARDIANAPPNAMNPDGIERTVTELAESMDALNVKVIRGEELKKRGVERYILRWERITL